jgi:hypothetical protein
MVTSRLEELSEAEDGNEINIGKSEWKKVWNHMWWEWNTVFERVKLFDATGTEIGLWTVSEKLGVLSKQ